MRNKEGRKHICSEGIVGSLYKSAQESLLSWDFVRCNADRFVTLSSMFNAPFEKVADITKCTSLEHNDDSNAQRLLEMKKIATRDLLTIQDSSHLLGEKLYGLYKIIKEIEIDSYENLEKTVKALESLFGINFEFVRYCAYSFSSLDDDGKNPDNYSREEIFGSLLAISEFNVRKTFPYVRKLPWNVVLAACSEKHNDLFGVCITYTQLDSKLFRKLLAFACENAHTVAADLLSANLDENEICALLTDYTQDNQSFAIWDYFLAKNCLSMERLDQEFEQNLSRNKKDIVKGLLLSRHPIVETFFKQEKFLEKLLKNINHICNLGYVGVELFKNNAEEYISLIYKRVDHEHFDKLFHFYKWILRGTSSKLGIDIPMEIGNVVSKASFFVRPSALPPYSQDDIEESEESTDAETHILQA